MIFNHLLQIINVVQKDVIQTVQTRIKVARHPQIDQKHGTAFAFFKRLFDHTGMQYIVRAAGGAYHHVGEVEVFVQLIKRHDGSIAGPGEFNRATKGAIGHHDGADPSSAQMTNGLFAHLAHTNDHGSLVFQTVKNRTGQINGRRAHRHRFGRNAGLGSHPFGNRERLVKTAVQHRSQGAKRGRRVIGVFYLPQNLGLTDHQRIET